MTDYEKLQAAIESLKAPGHLVDRSNLDAVLEAARAHLEAMPKPPRLVEAYHLEWVEPDEDEDGGLALCIQVFPTHKAADEARIELEGRYDMNEGYGRLAKRLHQCIRITGPHQHLVPA